MQTFLPYADFEQTAACLDYRRLGKQRVECLQILRTLSGLTDSWKNHPAVRMWRGYESCLIRYGSVICQNWIKRGYKDSCMDKILTLSNCHQGQMVQPPWLGNEAFHASHRSNLLRKDSIHYGQFGWIEPSDLPYVWPV